MAITLNTINQILIVVIYEFVMKEIDQTAKNVVIERPDQAAIVGVGKFHTPAHTIGT